MAEIWNMAARSTSRVDGYLNQILRATADVELIHGPDYRVTVGPASGGAWPTPYWGNTGAQNAKIILSRWPILEITAVKVCPNGVWPRTWTSVPSGFFEPMTPSLGVYGSVAPGGSADGGQAILVGGGYINRCYGRNGWAVEVSYINGYPHCSLTAAVLAGATTVTVNDCTGWAVTNYYGTYTGATGRVVDSGQQEAVHVTAASATTGPGTLTLSSPLSYPHQAGTLVTTMPASVEQACIYFCAAEALTRGATSTTIHAVGGASQSSDKGAEDLIAEGELLLHAFRRTILSLLVRFPGFLIAGPVPVAAGEQADGHLKPGNENRRRAGKGRPGRKVLAGHPRRIVARLGLLPCLGSRQFVQDGQFRLTPGDRVLRVVGLHQPGQRRVAQRVHAIPPVLRRVRGDGHQDAAGQFRPLGGVAQLDRVRGQVQPRLDLLPRPCGHVRFAHAQTLPPAAHLTRALTRITSSRQT